VLKWRAEMEYHKGEWCIHYPDVFCQEGYCSNCYLDKGGKMITGKCKAKDLIKSITKEWIFREHGIGPVWELDGTDTEIINSWRN
jgi:hypothetical protein